MITLKKSSACGSSVAAVLAAAHTISNPFLAAEHTVSNQHINRFRAALDKRKIPTGSYITARDQRRDRKFLIHNS